MKYSGSLSWLKQVISSNVFFYKAWFYSVRKWRGDYIRLPSIKDDFYFDGYPRSGNTFFAALLSKVYPNKCFTSHLHVIAGLKISLEFELPIFVMVRKPEDAVVSNLYRKVKEKKVSPSTDLIETLLVAYYNYYLFVKKHLGKIHTIRFESSIKNEVLVLQKIAEVAAFESQSAEYLKEQLDNFKIMMQKKEAKKESHASSLPNDDRERFKKKYMNKVLNASSYNIAESIYNELIVNDLVTKNQVQT